MFQLQSFGLEQSVDEVEDIELHTPAVDLSKDVTNLVYREITVQFDVGDLVLFSDSLNVFTEANRILCVLGGQLRLCSFACFSRLLFITLIRNPPR